jgi:PBP1b-binding outer membrane lipoprotein LpoB
MKKIVSLLTLTAVLIASCTKSTNTPDDNNNNINSSIVTGDFTITKFTDSDPDEDNAANFSSYVFTFSADGNIAAVKNGVTRQGSYTKKPSHEGEAAKLTISFSDAPLNELNKSWQIDVISDSQVHLSDDGNASEVLHFTAL